MQEPIVLLPELMCDARLFAHQVADLSKEHAVSVAPVTQGERIAEIASGLMPQLPAKFALAGIGLGGSVAMEILRRTPERITRIALIGTNPLAETPADAAALEPLIIGAQSGRLEEVIQQLMKPEYFAPGVQRTEVLARLKEMGQALGPELLTRQIRAMQRRPDQQGVLRRCKCPARVMCGAQDGLTPAKRHAFMAELIPYAELEIIEDAGHLPMLEQPEATTLALRKWLAQPLVLT